MPGGKLKRELAVMCCALACTGCQTLWDATGHVASDACAPPAPYEETVDGELAASSPEVRELVSVAHAHHLNGEPALAASALLDALEFEPDNRRVRTILAITLALEGHLQAAELQFIEAMSVAEAHYNLGVILFEQGDIKAAEQRFLRAVQYDANLQDARVWLDVARREMAEQTAKWHTEINPMPPTPRRTDVEHLTLPASIVELPSPMPVIQASATVAESEVTLPTIAPIQSAVSNNAKAATLVPSRVAREESSRGPNDGGPVANTDTRITPTPVHSPSEHDILLKGEREQRAPESITDEERKELERLRREVHQLRLEHEILKKAIGVIAADDIQPER